MVRRAASVVAGCAIGGALPRAWRSRKAARFAIRWGGRGDKAPATGHTHANVGTNVGTKSGTTTCTNTHSADFECGTGHGRFAHRPDHAGVVNPDARGG